MEITAEKLDITLGNAHILKGTSLKASDKKFVGLIGPNGSGKSTMLKCIYRVLKPNNGAAYIDGKNIYEMRPKESAQKMAVVSQHNFYNFDFTIEEVVLMGRSPHKRTMDRDTAEDYQIVDESLDKVGMLKFKGRSFSTLSGGEQQRVILARALAQKTDCIILDEPTNHLDIKYQLQLLDIVKSLNITVISAIHDLNIASLYCDYIYALKNGEIIHKGTVDEILTPDIIKELYEVDAEVVRNKYGKLNVTFYPKYLLEGK